MDVDELSPRGQWRLGGVVERMPSKGGLVRRVKISIGDKKLTKKGERAGQLSVLERPAQKLILLLEAGDAAGMLHIVSILKKQINVELFLQYSDRVA